MEKPSEAWKNYLHDNKSLDKAAHNSYELYLNKYAKDSTDLPRMEQFKDKFFIPGKIYSFLYVTESKPSKTRPFINRRPVVLSMGQIVNQGNVYETGIDLMLVPPKIRILILDQLFKVYKKDINENMKDQSDGKSGKRSLALDFPKAKALFDKLGWGQAYSAFGKGNIAKPVVYDYEDWVSVIPLYTKGIQGTQPKELYDNYVKKMTAGFDVDLNKLTS